jgi:hypothetical protein
MNREPDTRFLHKLCFLLGEWDVDGVAAQMPLRLFYNWMAYADMNPLLFNPDYAQARNDWNAAMTAAHVGNILIGLFAKRKIKIDVSDLMYKEHRRDERQKSPKELFVLFKTAVLLSAPND